MLYILLYILFQQVKQIYFPGHCFWVIVLSLAKFVFYKLLFAMPQVMLIFCCAFFFLLLRIFWTLNNLITIPFILCLLLVAQKFRSLY